MILIQWFLEIMWIALWLMILEDSVEMFLELEAMEIAMWTTFFTVEADPSGEHLVLLV